MKETALGLLIPEDTDVPNGPAQIGGNAEKADALFQAGGVAKRLYVVGESARTSVTYGSFGTPLLLTLPKVLANQMIEIVCFGWAKGTTAGSLRLTVPGNTSIVNGTLPRATNTFFTLKSTLTQGSLTFDVAANATPVTPLDKTAGAGGTGVDVLRYVNKEDRTGFTVELQGNELSGGTVTVTNVYLAARVWG